MRVHCAAMSIVLAALAAPSAIRAGERANAAPNRTGWVTHERLLEAASHPGQWLAHGGDYRNQQYSPLRQINARNVAGLQLAWSMDMDTNRGVEATPIVVDGVLYVTGSWSHLYAIDARTGATRWSFDPHVPGRIGPDGCCDVVSRGVAVWEGKVLLATFDGRLIAIDAASGKVDWSVDTIVDHGMPYTISGAPLVANGVVVIGNSGAEMGVRGYVTAYDIATGTQLWRFFTVPGDPKKPFESAAMKMAAATWKGQWWKYGGGGTVWDSMAYDPELDLIYLGVGNGGPWDRSFRSPGGGDNLFLSSIVAVKRSTGEYVWHYQETPGDSWDYTATQHIMLLDLLIDGQPRKTLVQAPKNGLFYVLDRATGKLISAKNYVPVNWMTRIDPATGRPVFANNAHYEKGSFDILPGPTGAHNWQPMAWSAQTGLVYIPALELGSATFAREPGYKFRPGFINVGVDFRPFLYPEDPKDVDAAAAGLKGHLIAWDPVAQREVWRVTHRAPWNGGVLATAGGLLFQGTPDGRLLAFDAADGTQRWQFDCQSGVMAAPVSYQIDGEQYIAVAVGWGSHYGVEWGEFSKRATGNRPNISRVVAFKLGGKAQLPPGRQLAPPSAPAVPIPAAHTPAMVERGRLLYAENCTGCHGGAAISGGVLPDLRYASAVVHEHWQDIVRGRMFEAGGMRNFSDRLSSRDAEDIRAYVLSRAHRTWKEAQRVKPAGGAGPPDHRSYPLLVSTEITKQIQQFLDSNCDAFNRGDLDAMMDTYDDSPDVTYVYEGQVFRGRAQIREDYAQKFFKAKPGENARATNEQLRLDLVQLDAVSPDVVMATARVRLGDPGTAKADDASMTTLLISRASGRWRIIYDHSS